jgi:hypothetical protein
VAEGDELIPSGLPSGWDIARVIASALKEQYAMLYTSNWKHREYEIIACRERSAPLPGISHHPLDCPTALRIQIQIWL